MRKSRILISAIPLLFACASPEAGVSGTQASKSADLAGFVAPSDLSTTSQYDFASNVSSDLATQQLSAKDLASPIDLSIPPDLTTPVDMSGPCGTITYAGECNGNTLTYCYNNTLQTLKCTAPTECTTVSGDSDCRFVAGTACDGVTIDGVCDGNTLAYCQDKEIVVVDCASQGLSCDVEDGFADCD